MGDSHIIAWSGSVDARTAPGLAASLKDVIADPSSSAVTIDLADVTVIDSTGLGALVQARNAAIEHDTTLTLRAVAPRVKSLLSRTGLISMFAIEPSD